MSSSGKKNVSGLNHLPDNSPGTGNHSKQHVLSGYFDALLRPVESDNHIDKESPRSLFFDEEKKDQSIESITENGNCEALSERRRGDTAKVQDELPLVDEIPNITQTQIIPNSPTIESHADEYDSRADEGMLDWQAEEFEVLMVKLDHASIAIPLLLIGSVYKINQPLIHIVRYPAWTLGVFVHHGKNFHVLDTQQLIGSRPPGLGVNLQPDYILTVAGSSYALACEDIDTVIKINRRDVRWRKQDGTKYWYRGILNSRMCILLDVHKLLEEWVH